MRKVYGGDDSGEPGDPERVVRPQAETGAPDWDGLAALGRRQEGVFAAQQLYALGFSADRLSYLAEQGRLKRHHRGFYVDPLVSLAPRAHLRAAQLALGPAAFFSHRTAAALLGLRPINTHAVELTVVSGHTPRREGLIVHRVAVPSSPVELRTTPDGLRHSSAARMLLELAAVEKRRELDRLIERCARRNLLDLDAIALVLRSHPRQAGRAALADALHHYIPPAHADASGLERDVAAWLGTLPDIPAPKRNVHVGGDGGLRWELDFYWPAHRMALEIDGGPYHHTPADIERDHLKDGWLQRHHHRILRITGFRFDHDRRGIHRDLVAMLSRS